MSPPRRGLEELRSCRRTQAVETTLAHGLSIANRLGWGVVEARARQGGVPASPTAGQRYLFACPAMCPVPQCLLCT